MQTAIAESTWPVLSSIKWTRQFHAMLATPLGVFDIVVGHLLHLLVRVLLAGTVFLGFAAMVGAVPSWTGILALPTVLLVGLAFAAPVFAFTTYLNGDTGFNILFRLVMIPLFLFSGTFFPISQLPFGVQLIARVTAAVARRHPRPGRHSRPARGAGRWGTRRTSCSGSWSAPRGPSTACAGGWWSEMSLVSRPWSRPALPALPARAGVVVERSILTYRRQWVAFATGFLEPVFYLLSIGVGVGALVGPIPLGDGQSVSYAEFVAPAMLAVSAMNGAVFDATYNMFFKLRYARTYESMLSTPVGVADIAAGELAWTLIRGGIYSLSFLVVALWLGLVVSWWAVLALPVALVIGLAFGAARDGGHDLDPRDRGLRLRAAGAGADDAALGHVLPRDHLSGSDALAGRAVAALPRRRAGARTDAGPDRLALAGPPARAARSGRRRSADPVPAAGHSVAALSGCADAAGVGRRCDPFDTVGPSVPDCDSTARNEAPMSVRSTVGHRSGGPFRPRRSRPSPRPTAGSAGRPAA